MSNEYFLNENRNVLALDLLILHQQRAKRDMCYFAFFDNSKQTKIVLKSFLGKSLDG